MIWDRRGPCRPPRRVHKPKDSLSSHEAHGAHRPRRSSIVERRVASEAYDRSNACSQGITGFRHYHALLRFRWPRRRGRSAWSGSLRLHPRSLESSHSMFIMCFPIASRCVVHFGWLVLPPKRNARIICDFFFSRASLHLVVGPAQQKVLEINRFFRGVAKKATKKENSTTWKLKKASFHNTFSFYSFFFTRLSIWYPALSSLSALLLAFSF